MKININPQKELLRWGPIDGRLIYPDFFNVAFTKYSKIFYSWPDVLWLCFSEKMIAICDLADLRGSGRKNFKEFILADKNFKKYYDLWYRQVKEILNLQKNISKRSLKNLSKSELVDIYKKWAKMYLNFWTVGELPEVANWGGEAILKEILENEIPPQNFIFVFERLSAPEDLSFYQRAELDLLELKKFLKNKKLFDKKLTDYQKKYFWILNSYHHSKVLSKSYFLNELSSYSPAQAAKKLKELWDYSNKVKKEKEKIIRKYKLGKSVAKIVKRLSFCIWWQDLRKYYIFLANHYIDLFLGEFSVRFKVNFNDLHYYNCSEIFNLLEKNERVQAKEIKSRYNNLVVHYAKVNNSLEYISGPKAKKIISEFTNKEVGKNTNEFKGLVVSQGEIVKAKTKIILTARNMSKMAKGDVLVAAMTSPDYILAMKKASAIVTDEGGMTCHAAIVSRELGIPCIVNTKIATKVLKDGDLVEVDTKKGIVKKIK